MSFSGSSSSPTLSVRTRFPNSDFAGTACISAWIGVISTGESCGTAALGCDNLSSNAAGGGCARFSEANLETSFSRFETCSSLTRPSDPPSSNAGTTSGRAPKNSSTSSARPPAPPRGRKRGWRGLPSGFASVRPPVARLDPHVPDPIPPPPPKPPPRNGQVIRLVEVAADENDGACELLPQRCDHRRDAGTPQSRTGGEPLLRQRLGQRSQLARSNKPPEGVGMGA